MSNPPWHNDLFACIFSQGGKRRLEINVNWIHSDAVRDADALQLVIASTFRLAVNKGFIFQQQHRRVNVLMMTLGAKRRKDGDRMGSDFNTSFHKLKLNWGDHIDASTPPSSNKHTLTSHMNSYYSLITRLLTLKNITVGQFIFLI